MNTPQRGGRTGYQRGAVRSRSPVANQRVPKQTQSQRVQQRGPSQPGRSDRGRYDRDAEYQFMLKQKRRRAVIMRRRIVLCLFLVLAVAAAFGGKIAYDVAYGAESFYEGVSVDGHRLTGYTKEQAKETLTTINKPRIDQMTLRFAYGSREWTILPEQLKVTLDVDTQIDLAWAQGHTGNVFERQSEVNKLKDTPYNGFTTINYDPAAIDALLSEIKLAVDREAVNATLEFDTGASEKFNIINEKEGLALDTAPLRAQAVSLLNDGKGGVINLEPKAVYPSVKADDLRNYTNRIVRVSTPLGSSTQERIFNIKKVLEYFNGMTIAPGETVSFNAVTGPRGLEQGYKNAKVILNEDLVDGEGGGVCQASTTLYQALVRAGIEITNRSKHSFPVSYVDIGCDAAIAYDYKDLAFRNNTEGPIFLQTSVASDKVYVTVYGRALPTGQSIKIVNDILETIAAPEPEVKRDVNAEFCVWEDEYFDKPVSRKGYKVRTYAVTYDANGKELDRKKLTDDYYKEVTGVRYVGVKPLTEGMSMLPPGATPRPR